MKLLKGRCPGSTHRAAYLSNKVVTSISGLLCKRWELARKGRVIDVEFVVKKECGVEYRFTGQLVRDLLQV